MITEQPIWTHLQDGKQPTGEGSGVWTMDGQTGKGELLDDITEWSQKDIHIFSRILRLSTVEADKSSQRD